MPEKERARDSPTGREEGVHKGAGSSGQKGVKQANSGSVTEGRGALAGGGEVVYVHPGASRKKKERQRETSRSRFGKKQKSILFDKVENLNI